MASSFFPKRFAVSLGLLGVLLSAPGWSQPKPLTEGQQQAQRLSEDAGRLFFEGNFLEALRLFTQAYELSQSPSLLYSIGLCYQKLGDAQAAQASFCRYLSSADTMRRTEATNALSTLTAPGEEPCPVSPTSQKTSTKPPAAQPKRALPVSLFLAGGAAGAGALLLRLVAPGGPGALLPKNFEPNATTTRRNHTAGLALSLTADLSLLAGGASWLWAKKRASTTHKPSTPETP